MQNEWLKHHKEVKDKILSTDAVIPAQRAAHKAGFSFSKLEFPEQLQIWDHIWLSATSLREQLHAFFFLESYLNKPQYYNDIWATSVAWQEQVDDWPLCDSLSKINSKLLTIFPEEVYKQLSAWNKSDNLWKRRQSLVSLLYYSRTKKAFLPFEKITTLVIPMLKDEEYYVQKGVGWTLREMSNVYPQETMAYLHTHIKAISAIAFTISIEKISEDYKAELKLKRKRSA